MHRFPLTVAAALACVLLPSACSVGGPLAPQGPQLVTPVPVAHRTVLAESPVLAPGGKGEGTGLRLMGFESAEAWASFEREHGPVWAASDAFVRGMPPLMLEEDGSFRPWRRLEALPNFATEGLIFLWDAGGLEGGRSRIAQVVDLGDRLEVRSERLDPNPWVAPGGTHRGSSRVHAVAVPKGKPIVFAPTRFLRAEGALVNWPEAVGQAPPRFHHASPNPAVTADSVASAFRAALAPDARVDALTVEASTDEVAATQWQISRVQGLHDGPLPVWLLRAEGRFPGLVHTEAGDRPRPLFSGLLGQASSVSIGPKDPSRPLPPPTARTFGNGVAGGGVGAWAGWETVSVRATVSVNTGEALSLAIALDEVATAADAP